jgi:hypothetical protein
LRDRVLVRATMMRGTLHLVTAEDYRGLRASLQAGLDASLRAVLRQRLAGVDLDVVAREALARFATPQTFDAVRRHLGERHPEWDVRAMGYAARLRVPLVQVPADAPWGYAAQADFVSAEGWLGAPVEPARDADALVLRYLAAYGPSTVADAQAWLGMPGLGPVFDRLRTSLVVLGGLRRADVFDLADAERPDADSPAPVRYLPEWDNMLIARGDARFVAAAHRKAVFLPGLRVAATFLVDGVVAGTWAVERKKSAATPVLCAFGPLSTATRTDLEAEGDALLGFVEPDAATRAVRFAS